MQGMFRMKSKSLKVNFVMNMILTMSSFIFPLITFPYVSRILLPVGTCKALNFVFLMASPLVVYFIIFAKESVFFFQGIHMQEQ